MLLDQTCHHQCQQSLGRGGFPRVSVLESSGASRLVDVPPTNDVCETAVGQWATWVTQGGRSEAQGFSMSLWRWLNLVEASQRIGEANPREFRTFQVPTPCQKSNKTKTLHKLSGSSNWSVIAVRSHPESCWSTCWELLQVETALWNANCTLSKPRRYQTRHNRWWHPQYGCEAPLTAFDLLPTALVAPHSVETCASQFWTRGRFFFYYVIDTDWIWYIYAYIVIYIYINIIYIFIHNILVTYDLIWQVDSLWRSPWGPDCGWTWLEASHF